MLQYRKILVPVDFAKISSSAITQAAEHSEASNSELLVVHVIDQADTAGETAEVDKKMIAEKEAQLDELLDSLEIGYCEKLVITGVTVPALLALIEKRNIDLVVMGTHTAPNPPSWVRSITTEVVANTRCDVLVLHK